MELKNCRPRSTQAIQIISVMEGVYEKLVAEVADGVLEEVVSRYSLEDQDFIDLVKASIVSNFTARKQRLVDAIAPSQTNNSETKKRRTKGDKKSTRPAKKSGYNLFIKEEMQTPEAKALNAKERMSHCATVWSAMSDDDKNVWKQKAADLNSAAEQELAAAAN